MTGPSTPTRPAAVQTATADGGYPRQPARCRLRQAAN